MKNIINWFEIPVIDMDRAKKFYETLFGFDIRVEQMGDTLMGFFPCLCDCQEECPCVGGALVKADDLKPSGDGTFVYFDGGADMQGILDKVEPAGGKIAIPKTIVTPEIGYIAELFDSEGNRIALHSKA